MQPGPCGAAGRDIELRRSRTWHFGPSYQLASNTFAKVTLMPFPSCCRPDAVSCKFPLTILLAVWVQGGLLPQGCHADESTSATRLVRAQRNQKIFESARRVLDAYRAQDIRKVLDLSTTGPATESTIRQFRPGTRRYKSLFGNDSWRWKAVRDWNTKLSKVRFRRRAEVQLNPPDAKGEAGFLSLDMERNQWRFASAHWMSVPDASPDSNEIARANRSFVQVSKAAIPILEAHRKRDVDAVLKLSIMEGPDALMFLNDEDSKKPKAELLFSEEPTKAVSHWKGKLHAVRIEEYALVEIGRDNESVLVVTLVRHGDDWKFEDIHNLDPQAFKSLND